MKSSDIAIARLISQQIVLPKFGEVKDLAVHMGAMQAQDYAMAKFAIGLRLPGSTDKQIEEALNKGEVIRAHVLRPTWHIVPAEDIHWMLALSCNKIKAKMKLMDRYLELTEKVLAKSNSVIEKCLRDGSHLTREDIAARLAKAKIATDGSYRVPHLLLRAEMDSIVCSGKMEGNKRTYALLSEWAPKKKILNREESLALLATRYFMSHGPAAIDDFAWWSGQTLTDAKQGLEAAKYGLESAKIKDKVYWFDKALSLEKIKKPGIRLLPAFDEFIISYKDRTASLGAKETKKIITKNGIFNPVIIENGLVKGAWKRSIQKDVLNIETIFFQPVNKSNYNKIKKEATLLNQFLGLKAAAIVK